MAARIASKSRSKIANPDLSRSLQRGISVASGNWAHQASTPGALCTTHKGAGAKGSHESAAAAGVPAAQLCLCRLHLRCRRLLHPSRHRHRCLHLDCRHRSPHPCHHPHPHPLLLLHRHYRRPHYLLQLPCPACPC
ncbi:unnamed protein product [Closterium sp. NIES-54]